MQMSDFVLTIESRAFAGSGVSDVQFGKRLQEIQSSAFRSTPITALTLPANLEKIGNRAFESCASLRSVTFENSLGWTVLTSKDVGLVGGSPSENAWMLRDEYCAVDWVFYPVLNVKDLSYRIVKGDVFSGEETDESELSAGETYYLIVEFDLEKQSACSGRTIPYLNLTCSGPGTGSESGFQITDRKVLSGSAAVSEASETAFEYDCFLGVGESEHISLAYGFTNSHGGRSVNVRFYCGNAQLQSDEDFEIFMSSSI